MPSPLDFSILFDRLPHAMTVLDRELRVITANPAFLHIVGSPIDQLRGRSVAELFLDEPARAIGSSLLRVLSTSCVDELAVAQFRVGASTERRWSVRHTPLCDAEGEVTYIVQELNDVTHLVAVDDQPHVQLRNLRKMFAQAPGFIAYLTGNQHVFEVVNDAYLQLVGHRDVVGMRVRDALPEVVEQGFVELLDGVFSTGTPFLGKNVLVQLQRAPGANLETAVVDFIYQSVRDESGIVVGIFVQGQDVTVHHRAEQERQLAEARRQFLIEVVPNQVWTATVDGKLDFVSSRVVAYFRRSAEEILGDGWITVLHPDDVDAVVARWVHSLTSGDPYEVEFRLRNADGEYRWHLGRANPERDANGAILKWIGTNTDIHDAKVALAELTARAQYEQRLIGIVSHDLRNPFNAITLGAAALASRDLDPSARRILERVARSAERAARLVNDLLDFAKARLGSTIPINPRPTNLREIVEQVVDECQAAAPGRLIRVGHIGDETGIWDADRIAQVISNLVGNAIQHGTPSAPIMVESRIVDGSVVLTVANEGPGIPQDELGKLFEPYQRGSGAGDRHGSMGLGLYIAREVIAAHGGTIEVESQLQATTCFTVRLPRISESQPS